MWDVYFGVSQSRLMGWAFKWPFYLTVIYHFIRYDILRDKLLLEMLKHHIGEGMWTVLSEDEQQERFMQLKMHIQRLRKDGKLDGAHSLPGAGLMYSSNLQALMGFSRIGEEFQRVEESARIKQMEKDGKNLSGSDFLSTMIFYLTLFINNVIS